MDWFLKSLVAYASRRGDWLVSQGYPQKVVDFAERSDSTPQKKYVVWIAQKIRDSIADKMGVERTNKVFRYPEWENHAMPRIRSMVPHEGFRNITDWADGVRPPPDLMHMSYEEAYRAAEDWHAQMKASEDEELASGYKSNVEFDFGNGWKMVSLVPSDCYIEGELMGHCVGRYGDRLERDKTMWIYSLRDQKNMPHATIEAYVKEDRRTGKAFVEIVQIQGKENNEPIDKYAEMIKTWIADLKGREGVERVEWSGGMNPEYEDNAQFENYDQESTIDRYGIVNDPFDIDDAESLLEHIFNEAENNYRGRNDVVTGAIRYAFDFMKLKPGLALDKLKDAVYSQMDEIFEAYSENYVHYKPYPNEEDFVDDDGNYDPGAYEEAVEEFQEEEQRSIDYAIKEDDRYKLLGLIMDDIKYFEKKKEESDSREMQAA